MKCLENIHFLFIVPLFAMLLSLSFKEDIDTEMVIRSLIIIFSIGIYIWIVIWSVIIAPQYILPKILKEIDLIYNKSPREFENLLVERITQLENEPKNYKKVYYDVR